ncbi:MAG: 2-C-methyl-D-erythritol 2,4-cyclodiphosphate synthase [Syntrophorhabdales bacterium]|jgi:2-C-methyl-D-erythritol 2,4-cyclodiphosphate synthase
MRIGLGYDAHAFIEDRPLFLGGVRIAFDKGLLGHSDGDVLLHAISDAVLGAAGADDIGVHFPNTDKTTEGMESAKILGRCMELARTRGYELVNLDAVVVAEAPRIMPYREEIRTNIARIMAVDVSRISVKGKTTEGMGFTGKKEGIESFAVCLLMERGAPW